MGVRLIKPEERREGQATPGMRREEAIVTDRMWAGLVVTAPGMVSGWHHHGDYETAICVLTGAFRTEFGPGGGEALEAGPRDFLFVEPGGYSSGEQPERRGPHCHNRPLRLWRARVQRRRPSPST